MDLLKRSDPIEDINWNDTKDIILTRSLSIGLNVVLAALPDNLLKETHADLTKR